MLEVLRQRQVAAPARASPGASGSAALPERTQRVRRHNSALHSEKQFWQHPAMTFSHRVPKKEATKFLAITFSNLNRFS